MKSNNKIQYIVIILLILLILYLSVNNMEKFTVTPASSSEAIANITSMYNNGKLTATAIDVTGNIKSTANIDATGNITTTGSINSSGNINSNGTIAGKVVVATDSLAAGSIQAQGRITAGNHGEPRLCIKTECIDKEQLASLTREGKYASPIIAYKSTNYEGWHNMGTHAARYFNKSDPDLTSKHFIFLGPSKSHSQIYIKDGANIQMVRADFEAQDVHKNEHWVFPILQ